MEQTRYTIQQHTIHVKSKIKLSHVNMYHCESDTHNIAPGYPYSKLIFVQKGFGQIHLQEQIIPVKENDLFIMNPDKHRFSVYVTDSTLEFTVLGIENIYFESKDNSPLATFQQVSFLNDNYVTIARMMIREISNHLNSFELACNYYMNLLLIEIERETNYNYSSASKEKKSKDCRFVKEYLDAHYTENITLDVLSEKSEMNKYYLVHSFTKTFGCSPISYLNEKRIEESKRLLETTNLSIAEIAVEIGFSSQSYFSQSFKKNTYMTPNEYRRSTRIT